VDTSAEGNIKIRHAKTPIAQNKLISFDDFLFSILTIKGIFQSGKIIAAIKPISFIIFILVYRLKEVSVSAKYRLSFLVCVYRFFSTMDDYRQLFRRYITATKTFKTVTHYLPI
jgi:hypothetical protein